jgi:hypothetical protein
VFRRKFESNGLYLKKSDGSDCVADGLGFIDCKNEYFKEITG